MSDFKYHDQLEENYNKKIAELLKILPGYCTSFTQRRIAKTQASTRYTNLLDIKNFIDYLKQNEPSLKNIPNKDIPVSIFEKQNAFDFDEYSAWLYSYHDYDGISHANKTQSVKRKIASLKSFYKFLFAFQFIESNPCELAQLPTIHKSKSQIRILEQNEREEFIEELDRAYDAALINLENEKRNLTTGTSKLLQANTIKMPAIVLRDKAIFYLFVGTGLRISELVGIDLSHFSIENARINIKRKGGSEDVVYLSDTVMEFLETYIEEARPLLLGKEVNDALFISNKHTRMTPRSIELMIKKYADHAFGAGHGITPHKLRATFGTMYYRMSHDIKATADVMSHSSIQTTSDYYAKSSEESKLNVKNLKLD